MRMKGMIYAKNPELDQEQQPKALKKKTRVDPVTGIRYLNKGWYEQAVQPKMPPKVPTKIETVGDLIQQCHYFLVRDWDKPEGSSLMELVGKYGAAIQLGFKGHMGNWKHNILAGKLVAGKVDLTPRKLLQRFG